MMNCIWNTALRMTSTSFITFVNSDIVLLDDFADTFAEILEKFKGLFVTVGERMDNPFENLIDFNDPKEIKQLTSGDFHGEWGLDYWIFPTNLFHQSGIDFLPFLLGVYRWDNWLLSEFVLHEDVTVIDATSSISAVHLDDPQRKVHSARNGAQYNDNLAKHSSGMQYRIGNVFAADKQTRGRCGARQKCYFSKEIFRFYNSVYNFK
jgi:hypothetical protein